MKKSRIIVLVVIAALVVAAVIWGKNYYDSRYVGSDYYAMIPLNYDVTPESIYSDSGEDVGLGKEYNLTAYNDQGEAKEVSFNVMLDNTALPQPGDYLLISASKQIVVRWQPITRDQVPAAALAKLS